MGRTKTPCELNRESDNRDRGFREALQMFQSPELTRALRISAAAVAALLGLFFTHACHKPSDAPSVKSPP